MARSVAPAEDPSPAARALSPEDPRFQPKPVERPLFASDDTDPIVTSTPAATAVARGPSPLPLPLGPPRPPSPAKQQQQPTTTTSKGVLKMRKSTGGTSPRKAVAAAGAQAPVTQPTPPVAQPVVPRAPPKPPVAAPATAAQPVAGPSTVLPVPPPTAGPSAVLPVPPPAAAAAAAPGALGYVVTRRKGHALGPHKLRITNSDGDPARWPSGTDLTPTTRPSDGKSVYYVEFAPGSSRHQTWLKGIGRTLAKRLNLVVNDAEKWELEDFPAGYKMFEHHMGQRTDPYMFGPTLPAPKAKLRSTNEAADHIISLCLNEPCVCKYCQKSSGGSTRGVGSSSPRASPARSVTPSVPRVSPVPKKAASKPVLGKRPRSIKSSTGDASDTDAPAPKRAPRTGAGKSTKPATSSSLKPVGRDATEFQGPFADPMRRRELNAPTFARAKELVWCSVEPLTDPDPAIPALDWWPAIVLEHETVKTNRRVEDGVLKADEATRYRCRLLGVCDDDVALRPADQLLPWLSRATEQSLFTLSVVDNPGFELSWDLAHRRLRTPSPHFAEFEGSVRRAITSYAYAVQTATEVACAFTLIDRFERKAVGSKSVTSRDPLNAASHDHYQSLAWGPEIVYEGDIVRLLTYEYNLKFDEGEPAAGKDDRPLNSERDGRFFLRIQGLFRHCTTDHAVVSGTIYELEPLPAGSSSVEEADADAAWDAMAPPPPGHRWKRLTPPGKEQTLDVEHLAGRLYQLDQIAPGGDASPRLQQTTRLLAGLGSAHDLYARVKDWQANRATSMTTAEDRATKALSLHVAQIKREAVDDATLARAGLAPAPMQID